MSQTKPLPPSMIGLSRRNIEDLVVAYFSTKYAMPLREQLTFKWTGFEHELEMRTKPNA